MRRYYIVHETYLLHLSCTGDLLDGRLCVGNIYERVVDKFTWIQSTTNAFKSKTVGNHSVKR